MEQSIYTRLVEAEQKIKELRRQLEKSKAREADSYKLVVKYRGIIEEALEYINCLKRKPKSVCEIKELLKKKSAVDKK